MRPSTGYPRLVSKPLRSRPGRRNPPEPPLLATIRDGVIGDDQSDARALRPRRVTYADYTASRPRAGLPRGLHPRRGAPPLREHAHREQRHFRSADDAPARGTRGDRPRSRRVRRRRRRDLHRLRHHRRHRQARRPAALRLPADLDHRYHLSAQIPPEERLVVFIGPFEHHSNEPPWRESIADVVQIPRTLTATSTSPGSRPSSSRTPTAR